MKFLTYFLTINYLFVASLVSADSNLNQILLKAENENLSFNRQWILLNHYWQNSLGQLVSRIDDPDFFVSQTRTDPRAELKSFIKELFVETKENSPQTTEKSSLQCRFPARFHWLDQKLNLTRGGHLQKRSCPEFETWSEALALQKVVLVFPSAYLNNPASMFGHTLLRLDSKEGIENPLLSYAASFGAGTGPDGGIAFALKGLSGGYRASFTVEPYYETVKKYGDIEHRDIWEFELNLSPKELDLILRSLWELGHTYFDYYFFDENCSFYLLALLETVKPELFLLDKFGYWVIPSDTLKILTKEKDLIGKISYRPSLTKRLESKSKMFSSTEIDDALKLASGELDLEVVSNLEQSKQASLLEFSFDYLEYLNSKKDKGLNQDQSIARSILNKRSKLPASKKTPDNPLSDSRPDLGHDSSRLLTSLGVKDSTIFYEIEGRPAYHDLLDPKRGFKEGAAIEFFKLGFRHYESDKFQLQDFTLISIESLSPINPVISPFSWMLNAGLFRESIPEQNNSDLEGSLVGGLDGAYGVTFNLFESVQFSFLPSVASNFSPSYVGSDFALGIGATSKLIWAISDSLRTNLSQKSIRFGVGDSHTQHTTNVDLSFDVLNEVSLRGGISYQNNFSQSFLEYSLGLAVYF